MKFIADIMLGKLAKWLRIAGIDVLYSNKMNDEDLIKLSLKTDRILLTRDRKLSEDKRLRKIVMIENEHIEEQLKEFFEKTKICPSKLFSRCLICNEPLQIIEDKRIIKDKVPKYTYLTNDVFSICQKCDKIYWKGTHRENMEKRIRELLQKIN